VESAGEKTQANKITMKISGDFLFSNLTSSDSSSSKCLPELLRLMLFPL
jgi:hypothetical protein